MNDWWKGITDAQHAAMESYLRELGDRLLLRDCVLDLSRQHAADGCWAAVIVSDVENQATFYLGKEFFAHDPEQQREYLTHEVLHVIVDRPARVVAQLAEQWSDNSACQFAKEAQRKEIEIVVNHLARLLAPMMPLPPAIEDAT